MTYFSRVFGIFESPERAEAAADILLQGGVAASCISVLLPENPDTREFARRKGTRIPAGVASGEKANLPLAGTLGMGNPAVGPIEGALPEALAGMGVPADWLEGRVVHGKVLLSAECHSTQEAEDTANALRNSGAEDIGVVITEQQGVEQKVETIK